MCHGHGPGLVCPGFVCLAKQTNECGVVCVWEQDQERSEAWPDSAKRLRNSPSGPANLGRRRRHRITTILNLLLLLFVCAAIGRGSRAALRLLGGRRRRRWASVYFGAPLWLPNPVAGRQLVSLNAQPTCPLRMAARANRLEQASGDALTRSLLVLPGGYIRAPGQPAPK